MLGPTKWGSDMLTIIKDFFGNISNQLSAWVVAGVKSGAIHGSLFLCDAVAVVVIAYGIYCSCRTMVSTRDESFNSYVHRTLIALIGYFICRVGQRWLAFNLLGC